MIKQDFLYYETEIEEERETIPIYNPKENLLDIHYIKSNDKIKELKGGIKTDG